MAQAMPEEAFICPASFAQQRLWFVSQLAPENPVFNLNGALRLTMPLSVGVLERSLDEIVRRHEALRTTFGTVDGQPVQMIAARSTSTLRLVDLRGLAEGDKAAEVMRLATAEARQPFDLARGPLLRTTLLQLGGQEHVFLLTLHHIVSDGWSVGLFWKELSTLYYAFAAGQSSPLPELPIQYADYALWQREWLQGDVLEQQLQYWKRQLADLPILQLPTDHPRPAVQSFRGAYCPVLFPPELTRELKGLSQREGVTLFMTLLAAFQLLLMRYTAEHDIAVGCPIAGRSRPELEGLIGFFVNTLVMRVDLRGQPTFKEVLARVREVALGAYAHQDIPFEMLVEKLQPSRDLSRNPLVQVVFQLFNAPSMSQQTPVSGIAPLEVQRGTAMFDLNFTLWESSEGLNGTVEYDTSLFEAETISRMVRHFRNLLEQLVASPDRRLSDLPLLSEPESHQLLVEWNDTSADYPRNACIHELVEARAKHRPDAPALSFEGRLLTYGQLNAKANQLAHYLRKLGVGPETLVGIFVERSLESIIGMLGILKAGGAYVPLDPAYPKERLAFMVADTKMQVILTQEILLDALPEHCAEIVCLDGQCSGVSGEPEENPPSTTTADNLAYVMYTSGSTGIPKGVAVVHRGVVRLVTAQNYANLGSQETFLQFAPISFDASTFEIWAPLANGGQLFIFPPGTPSMQELGEAVEAHRITTLWVTSVVFHETVDECLASLRHVRQLITGGDIVSIPHVRRLLDSFPDCCLIHAYGPTENTTFTTYLSVTASTEMGSRLPIGRPILNTQLYVLDPHMQPVPIGVAGELYIGGDGLAREYYRRPELTADKFVRNLFSTDPDARLYKTGDLVRYLPDGNLQFLGRIDNQVKIRGFRIELGEIETALKFFSGVQEAVAMVRTKEDRDKQLVAYVVAQHGVALSASEMKSYLREKLPEFMVPTAFVVLDAMPVTPSGKLDRRLLPEPEDVSPISQEDETPQNELERSVFAVWQEVLQKDSLGLNDNFFDLGGHSLLLARVHSKLQSQVDRQLSMTDLFQYPTIRSLATYLGHDRIDGTFLDRARGRARDQREAAERRNQAFRGQRRA